MSLFYQLETYKRSFEETLAEKRGLEAKLQEEERLKALVEKRFNTLAENHEEMIKIKDEYKHSNQALMVENKKLKQENQMKFSAAVEERESQLSRLREELGAKYQRERELEECCTRLEARVAETEKQLCLLKEKSGKEAERLEERLSGEFLKLCKLSLYPVGSALNFTNLDNRLLLNNYDGDTVCHCASDTKHHDCI